MSREPEPSSPLVNATVMASAGTGKTWLLVSRLLRLLLHGATADAILAITFTRKAAAEMQTRLSERLFALASADDEGLAALLRELSLTPDEATMSRARGLYESMLQSGKSVRTTTFHAFCQEILRRFPLEADVPPGFELLESSGELTRASWDALMEQATKEPDGELAQTLEPLLAYCGGISALQQALSSFLTHRGDWWAYTEGQSAPLPFAEARLRQQLQLDEGEAPLEQLFTPELMQQLANYCELLGKHKTSGNEKRLTQLADIRNPELEPEIRFALLRETLLTQKNEPRACKPSKAQAKSMGEEGQDRFIELHGLLSLAVMTTLDKLSAIATLEACSNWYAVGSQLLENFQRLKAERRLLDFTDLEWRAYRLLYRGENAQWVQYKLDQRIEHLLVDEFQDTNPTQWRLLQPLLQEMASGAAERHRSVFLVGDAKQSIYRFRRAEPRLFQAAHEWLTQHLQAHSYPLHTSWRSSSAIMQAVNKLFGESGPMQGILRDFTPHQTHLQGLWGRVTVLPLISDSEEVSEEITEPSSPLRNPLHQPRIVENDQRYQHEGEMIATEITRLIAEKTVIGMADAARPMRYGDIMILVRSRSHVGEYERALRQAGIPYLGAERGTLLQSLEVRDMVALLELLITPYNNLSLAHVLRSPLFDCSNEDLALLALMDKNNGSWYQRLATLAQHDTEHPLHRAWQLLVGWREQVGKLPIHDLLDRIFNEGNVLARYRAAYPPHLQGRCESNLTRFVELALSIDSGRYPSLGRFLNRLGEMRENSDEAPDEAPAGGDGDRVRLMTIHASKGLEAPVVFLADSGRGAGIERPFRTLVEWPAQAPRPDAFLLVGKKGQQDAFTRQAIEREHSEEHREDANLLYVALTRARQHLYLSACAPRRGEELGWYGAMRKALDPLEEIAAEEPCLLEYGTQPPPGNIAGKEAARTSVEIPEALSRPIELKPQYREIAPSFLPDQQRHSATMSSDEDGRQRGVAIHRMLELMTGVENTSTHAVMQQVAQEQGIADNSGELQSWLDEAEKTFAHPRLKAVMHPASGEAHNEIPIIYQQAGRTVHGIIDRLILTTSEVWVVDYKTHRHATADNQQQLALPYREQLRYYAKGVERLWPEKKARCFLLFTACGSLLEVDTAA